MEVPQNHPTIGSFQWEKPRVWDNVGTTIDGTLWLFNIAMENGPFIDGLPCLPIKNGDFPWLC
jgi:hypothetical protein